MKDFIAQSTTKVSGTFTVNGDQATFASNNGANSSTETPTNPSTDPKKGSSSTGIIAFILVIAIAIRAYFFIQKFRGKKLEEDGNTSLIGDLNRV